MSVVYAFISGHQSADSLQLEFANYIWLCPCQRQMFMGSSVITSGQGNK